MEIFLSIIFVKRPTESHQIGLMAVILSCLMIVSSGVVSGVSSAVNFSFDGEIRTRFESLNGLNAKAYGDSSVNYKGKIQGESNDNRMLSRVIAGFTYSWNKKIRLFAD